MSDDTLDMRMDKTQEFSALDVVNKYSEEKLADIIYEYGEERFSRRIAKSICENRPITKTSELAKIIEVIPIIIQSFKDRFCLMVYW